MGYPGPVQYGVSEQPLANIYAAVNYGKHGRGFGTGPGQIGSGHGYAEGGPVGMAAGGTVAGLRSKLSAEQAGEQAKYFGLEHSYAIGPKKFLTVMTKQELATLARDQATERTAFAALSGSGLTTSHMHHLGATTRAELRTASDKELSRSASLGGHPLFAADLRKYLSQLSATASGTVPGTAGGKAVVPTKPADVAKLRANLAAAEKGERAKYFGLEHSYAIGPKKFLTKMTVQELRTLAARQATETAAYAAIAGKGLTTANLSHLGATARSEITTALDKTLNRSAAAGGHPLFDADLRKYLAQISTLAGTKITPGGVSGGSGGSGGTGVKGPPLPSITHTYGELVDPIEAFLQAHVSPFGAARGGLIKSFDRGGYLKPGFTMAYNGTGRNEPVGAAAGGDVHVHLHVHGPVGSQQQLEQWLLTSVKKVVKTRGGGSTTKTFDSH